MTELSSEAGPPRSFFKKIFGPKHTEQGSSLAPKKDNLSTVEGIDRRQFLISSLAALLAWKARRTSVAKAAGVLASRQAAVPASPDAGNTVKKLPKRVEVNEDFFEFEDVHFVNREGKRDSMKVLGSRAPLRPQEMDTYVQSRKEADMPPRDIRTAEIIIGSEAWKKWRHDSYPFYDRKQLIAGGEHILSFIKRHFVYGMEEILRKTRPEAGLNRIKMEGPEHFTRVIVVDEQWLKDDNEGMYGGITSGKASGDVYARYYIPEPYTPMVGPANDYKDYGIYHELSHFSFGLSPHLHNYFLRLENWNSYAHLPEDIAHGNIKLWNLGELQHQMRTWQLMHPDYEGRSESLLSQPEELFVNRGVRSFERLPGNPEFISNPQYKQFANSGPANNEMATRYDISTAGTEVVEAELYSARLGEIYGADNQVWDFNSAPVKCMVKDGKIQLLQRVLTGGIHLTSNPDQEINNPKAFLVVIKDSNNRQIVVGFTSYHLQYWHYLEQMKNGETQFGSDGRKYPVTVNLGDFE